MKMLMLTLMLFTVTAHAEPVAYTNAKYNDVSDEEFQLVLESDHSDCTVEANNAEPLAADQTRVSLSKALGINGPYAKAKDRHTRIVKGCMLKKGWRN